MARLFHDMSKNNTPSDEMLMTRAKIMDRASAGHKLSDQAIVLLGMAIEAAYDAGVIAERNDPSGGDE